jgi:poly(A) polymerase
LTIREIVLQRVAVFVKKFVWTASVTCGLAEAMANAAGGKIFIYGSYGLGVYSPGDDLDILCVVPKHISRDDFFTVFKRMLRKVKGISGILVSDALTCIMTGK